MQSHRKRGKKTPTKKFLMDFADALFSSNADGNLISQSGKRASDLYTRVYKLLSDQVNL